MLYKYFKTAQCFEIFRVEFEYKTSKIWREISPVKAPWRAPENWKCLSADCKRVIFRVY